MVSRRNEDPTQGFNRSLSLARAREIARYLDSEKMTIPTNIVVSAQASAQLRFHRRELTWTPGPGAFLVLDGQHRLFSMEFTQWDYVFGATIYQGLTRRQEVRLFIDINTTQKGVPASLLLDIKQMAGTETDEEETLRQWFDYIANTRGSPLRGQMSAATAKKGAISRPTFNSALRKVIDSGVMDTLPEVDQQGRLLLNYLTACDRTITAAGAKRNRLTNGTMLSGFFELFGDVVNLTIGRGGKLRAEDLSETMEPWRSIMFDSYVGSNNAVRSRFVKDLRTTLEQRPTITPDLL